MVIGSFKARLSLHNIYVWEMIYLFRWVLVWEKKYRNNVILSRLNWNWSSSSVYICKQYVRMNDCPLDYMNLVNIYFWCFTSKRYVSFQDAPIIQTDTKPYRMRPLWQIMIMRPFSLKPNKNRTITNERCSSKHTNERTSRLLSSGAPIWRSACRRISGSSSYQSGSAAEVSRSFVLSIFKTRNYTHLTCYDRRETSA